MKYLVPNDFAALMPRVVEEYKQSGVFFLSEDYIRAIDEKTSAFPHTLESLLSGAEDVKANEDASLYALFLYRAMEDRSLFLKNLPFIEIPDEDFPFLSVLSMIPYIDNLYAYLCEKGLPKDVVSATVRQYEECMFLHEERSGCLGMSKRYFDHMQRYVDLGILNIGRLRFELHTLKDAYLLESRKTGKQILFQHSGEFNSDGLYADTPPILQNDSTFTAFFKETDHSYIGTPVDENGRCMRDAIELDKNEYFIRLPIGSACLSVHIPARGALTHEACEESYKRAKELFSTLHPELKISAFRCHSWMMAPELKSILRPGSNLLDFQAPYLKYPCKTKGEDVYNFVFKTKPIAPAKLPEDTSLQRALKAIYLAGGYLYEYNGIFTM